MASYWTTDSSGSSTTSARTTLASDDLYFVAAAGTDQREQPIHHYGVGNKLGRQPEFPVIRAGNL